MTGSDPKAKPPRALPPAPPLPPASAPRPRTPEQDDTKGETAKDRPDPTRFGDWEKNGRCIDF